MLEVKRRDFITLLGSVAAVHLDIALVMAQGTSQLDSISKDQASSDSAVVLVQEFAAWFRNLALQGVVPRTFTGVKRDGKQAIVILTGLPLDHVQRRDFLIWLYRTEGFVAYAYGTHVGIAADSASTLAEGIDIYASSDRYDASKTLGIDRLTGGTLKIVEHNLAVMPASPENGIFLGLQRSTTDISSDNQKLFRNLWRDERPNAKWRQR
jgi:hypothetical protein